MSRCLQLAQKAAGHTSPNPLVGAVIVKNGKLLAGGYHHKAGLPHAEIEALKKISFRAEGATLYCNLEPCFHHGRTPPCVHPIIKSGIKRVVIAHRDPNPLVAGRSVRLLKKSGIQVTEGVLEKEARHLNRFFLTWVTKKRPYVILKAGVSLDGKIAGGKKWITSPPSRRRVHQLRSQVDAILVGAHTIRTDNPRLNVRGIKGAKQPLRIILGSRRQIPVNARIFAGIQPCPPENLDSRLRGNDRLMFFRGALPTLMRKLARRNVTSILVEGGAKVFASFIKNSLCDELILFIAPKILGPSALDVFPPSLLKKFPFKISSITPSGPDLEVRFGTKKKGAIAKACQNANKDAKTNRLIREWQGFDEKADGEWK
ncbi:MAG: bifunctional diaminohydroxyphosphoribosylaminopyrimidine deaminase/5-amino-6-(5-phosphoribosylamino)uracil reductase RibD [Deltaproteobacteria bacterium]|nr:bifunctional diaminohydroxyphosphoribosylaminopyrimidine deaminase/5-amino-6-(5-phosphoribosylamino)uracil reductase RibD [Deltaproteobacteria bacterium]